MKKIIILVLCMSLMTVSTASASSNYLKNLPPPTQNYELTDEIMHSISENMKKMNSIEAAQYYEEMIKRYTLNRVTISPSPNTITLLSTPNLGDTRYTISYSNSGITEASNITGTWASIVNSSISLVLGFTTYVGSILWGVVNLLISFVPDTGKTAKATNSYSYRYIQYNGEVYMNNVLTGNQWVNNAMSQSRELYEHGWGYFIDTNGLAHQSTIDFPTPKTTELAPYASGSQIQYASKRLYDGGHLLGWAWYWYSSPSFPPGV